MSTTQKEKIVKKEEITNGQINFNLNLKQMHEVMYWSYALGLGVGSIMHKTSEMVKSISKKEKDYTTIRDFVNDKIVQKIISLKSKEDIQEFLSIDSLTLGMLIFEYLEESKEHLKTIKSEKEKEIIKKHLKI